MQPLLEARRILKRYPGVLALDNVDLTVDAGQVHCLVGENGAGKSTLMAILSGALEPDEGEIFLDGKSVKFHSPRTAIQHGIGIIHQDLKLVPWLSVAENILLGNEPLRGRRPCAGRTPFIDRRALHSKACELLSQLGETIEPSLPLSHLSAAQRQIVEIAKALSRKVRILLLDEPTAALTEYEVAQLFGVINRLKADGVAIIYISHRLDEIFAIGDVVTVLRDGRVVQTTHVSDVDRRALIRWMVGRELEEEYPRRALEHGTELLHLNNVSARKIFSVHLTLHRGEILGLAGLVGAGRSELARVIFGAEQITAGTMTLDGSPYAPTSPRDAIGAGIGLLPEDRNRFGLVLQMSTKQNMTLANLGEVAAFFINRRREHQVADRFAQMLNIKPRDVSVSVSSLSGGNRQKVVLARWLFAKPRLLMFDEPTAGIDVGSRHEIYRLIDTLAGEGIGILMISSELPELLGMCDRIAVMCEGRIRGILTGEEATQEKILTLATPSNEGTSYAA